MWIKRETSPNGLLAGAKQMPGLPRSTSLTSLLPPAFPSCSDVHEASQFLSTQSGLPALEGPSQNPKYPPT